MSQSVGNWSSSGDTKIMIAFNLFSRRLYANHYLEMDNSEAKDIFKLSGCRKPCVYKRYNFVGEKQTSSFLTDHVLFSLWAVSNSTLVESDQLIYPLSSLVAEIGGLLGLFFGFSFMTVWDGLNVLKPWLSKIVWEKYEAETRTKVHINI